MLVEELLLRISSRELAEWMAYDAIEPFGERRADLRAGIITSNIVNCHIDSKSGRLTKPQDFIPDFEPKRQTWQEQIAVMKQVTAHQEAEARRAARKAAKQKAKKDGTR